MLETQRAQGKNDNMLRNAYIKFMCWLYYRFEQLLHLLGKDPLPRILYDGDLSSHEFQLFCILARAGCDILLIEPAGDAQYQSLTRRINSLRCVHGRDMHPFHLIFRWSRW